MKNSKKGFTLVELIIVVAVIALLAAVLIPTFSSLISKANQAKDEALVSNLNKAVALSTEKYDNVHDVLEAVKANAGFDVAKISASVSEHEILWDSVNYCFVYKTTDGVKYIPETQSTTVSDDEQYKFWQICDEKHPIPETQTYSIYWAGSAITKEVKVSVGFDAGEASVAAITYERSADAKAQTDVKIRTNGGTLTVNAAKDSVDHYNTADKVIIKAIDGNSYHENGDVVALVVDSGRVVVNEGATISTIVANDSSVKVAVPEGADTIVYAPVGTEVKGVERKDRPAGTEGTTNQSKFLDGLVKGSKYFAGGSGLANDPYLINNAEQIFGDDEDSTKLCLENTAGYYKIVKDIEVSDEIYLSGKTWTVDLNGHSVTLKYGKDVKPNNGSVFYIGGRKGNLTINDSSNGQGKVIGSDKSYTNKVTSAVRAGNYGKLTINGGHFYGTSEGTSCIFVYTNMSSSSKATVTINGGIFETATPSNGTYFVLNHQDRASAGCTITVNGGKFKNYNPGVTTVDPVNAYTGKIVLGEGCTTTQDGEWYIVSK